ncbi:hypothetical protein STAFG_4853 [Streptomyces afghaniensis 772]|uniref:Uncharacterized protein n=1 Tax=Streptomyces afghaniensis 772 TaxID=1283301 RepID=S4NI31_9ACTN|nr:hypothetical protein STAFG_4853 [Streptomyces afghaniensis 772]
MPSFPLHQRVPSLRSGQRCQLRCASTSSCPSAKECQGCWLWHSGVTTGIFPPRNRRSARLSVRSQLG